MTGGDKKDGGSAVLPAVLAAACFALIAGQMARTSRSEIGSVNAGLTHARLAADADAGLALAVSGLTAESVNQRWGIDRTFHVVDFDTASLTITVEDERGKIPLNVITEPQVRTLFQGAGAAPEAVTDLVNAFLDFRDPTRVHTSVSNAAVAAMASVREGGFRTVEELAQIPGMTPALYDAISSVVTVNSGDVPFDPQTAAPLALQVMTPPTGAGGSERLIESQREAAGEKTALTTAAGPNLVGRALTIRVIATDAKDGRAEKATIIQLTGKPERPFIVRQQNASAA